MNYRFDCDNWGAYFKIPASVVNEYIKQTDGDYIKVLLCILAGNRTSSSEKLAAQSGVSISDVDKAIAYWSEKGVISCNNEENIRVIAEAPVSPAEKRTETFSSKNEPVSIVESIKPAEKKIDSRIVVNYSAKEIREKAENDRNLKHLVNDIQSVLDFSINAKELGRLIELYEYYHFDVPTILLTAEYCASLGKRKIAYLCAVMVRWYEEGIVEYADVEKKIIESMNVRSFENKVLKIFGIDNKPSKQQREYMEKWNAMGFNIELLEIAYNKCMDATNKLNFGYINKILMSWAENNISTPEQVSINDAKFKSKFEAKKNIDDEKTDPSYDLDEFEQFAMNYSLSGGSNSDKKE